MFRFDIHSERQIIDNMSIEIFEYRIAANKSLDICEYRPGLVHDCIKQKWRTSSSL